jgi:hypothetical protein
MWVDQGSAVTARQTGAKIIPPEIKIKESA